jgi:2-polyprenyl-6-methoxyphenol hydroxylase-like FAD-dependent oxidoreductase
MANFFEVVIVGAGPTGLSLAIELGLRNISCLVLEFRDERTSTRPKAKLVNVRSMELFRRWGIHEEITQNLPLGKHFPGRFTFFSLVENREIVSFDNCFDLNSRFHSNFSHNASWLPQGILESILLKKAKTLECVKVLFSSRFVNCDEVNEKLDVTFNENDVEKFVRCNYLVGCDGARSHVREMISVKQSGEEGFARNMSVQFQSKKLGKAFPSSVAVWFVEPGCGILARVGENRWNLAFKNVKESFSKDDAASLTRLKEFLGNEEDFEVTSVDEWFSSLKLSKFFRVGRVLLAGDACHVHPPDGGFGMNMGIGDAVDLGWKLALLLHGGGHVSDKILDSFQDERRPVHKKVMKFVADLTRIQHLSIETDTTQSLRKQIISLKMKEFYTLGLLKGYFYAGSGIIQNTSIAPVLSDSLNYVPAAFPGSIAPHFWFHDGSSLYDLFGPDFTLLVICDANFDDEKLLKFAAEKHFGVKVLKLHNEFLLQLYKVRFCIVRPDHHLSWCGQEFPASFEVLFQQICFLGEC